MDGAGAAGIVFPARLFDRRALGAKTGLAKGAFGTGESPLDRFMGGDASAIGDGRRGVQEGLRTSLLPAKTAPDGPPAGQEVRTCLLASKTVAYSQNELQSLKI